MLSLKLRKAIAKISGFVYTTVRVLVLSVVVVVGVVCVGFLTCGQLAAEVLWMFGSLLLTGVLLGTCLAIMAAILACFVVRCKLNRLLTRKAPVRPAVVVHDCATDASTKSSNICEKGESNMSFEGYYQCVCANRHYTIVDYLDPQLYAEGLAITELRCEECGAKFVWTNLVDETNIDTVGEIKVHTDAHGVVSEDELDRLCRPTAVD